MQTSRSNAPSENWRVSDVPLRAVSPMSSDKTVDLDVEKPAGVPNRCFKLILDAESQRLRACHTTRPWRSEAFQALLRRLTESRAPSREPESDPLLWIARVRWAIRAASLSLPDLQPAGGISPALRLPERLSPTSTSFRMLASWAHRCCRVQQSDHQLLLRLSDQIHGRIVEADPLSDNTACHWWLWYACARGFSRADAFAFAVASGLFGNRWQKIPPGQILS